MRETDRYRVNVVERIKDLLGEDFEIGEHDVLSYSFSHGYEKLHHDINGGGSMNHAGSYHPDSTCDVGPGGGVCSFCGMTWL